MRALGVVLAAMLLAALPASAQTEHTLAAGSHLQFPIEAGQGDSLRITVLADRPVDIVLARGNASAYYAGEAVQVWAVMNNTQANAAFTLHDTSDLHLIIDNSAQPAGGAPGDQEAHADVDIVLQSVAVTPGNSDAGDFWHVVMLRERFWDLGAMGIGGIAIWLAAFAVLAAWGWRVESSKLLVLVVGIAILSFLWALLPHPGVVSQVGLPMLIGAGAGYVATKGSPTLHGALRLAFLGAFVGALIGLSNGHLVRGLWADNGILLIGGDRFLDALFTIPATAAFVAALLRFAPAFVEAMDDEEQGPAKTESSLQGPRFTVTCLRCRTPITVDRSMKRYRVATDRFEFACPNCSAWMEWAEPKAPPTA